MSKGEEENEESVGTLDIVARLLYQEAFALPRQRESHCNLSYHIDGASELSLQGHEAIESFWRTPEIAENLLPFLSAMTILALVQSGLLNIQILQGPVVWNKLIKRTIPTDENLELHRLLKRCRKWPPSFRS